jgi:hypothetical protein
MRIVSSNVAGRRTIIVALTLLGLTLPATAHAFEVQILSAVLKDKVIEGAEVILQKNGHTSVTATTDARGRIVLDKPFGGIDDDSVSMIVRKSGHSILVVKCPCNGLVYAVSPHMDDLEGLRVVLDWGANPKDLDSHLYFPRNHVFFSKKTGENASLDVDDVDGYGPETITLTRKKPGTKYLYAVHNYSEGDRKGSVSISTVSRVKVFVYIGKTLVRTFTPPRSRVGNTWVVFGIGADGEFYDINKFADLAERDAVGRFMADIVDAGSFQSVPDVSVDDRELAKRLNREGDKAYKKKHYDDAAMLFLEAIRYDPEFSQAYSNLGQLYQKTGQRAEGLFANRKAIALASGRNKNRVQAASYYNIARIYEDAGEWESALTNYQTAKRLRSHSAYDDGIARMKQKLGRD